jgi:UDP-galactopyranose mutase
VIYSGAIDELFGYRFGELPYRSLKFEPETVNTEYYQETAQVNYPNDYDFTRITEFKHFHNVKSNDTVIFREYPEKFKRGKNSRFYPVLTEKNLKLYQKYRIFARKYKNLILIGRLAEYKYYNMDEIIKKSLEIFQNKILPEERENGIKISGNIGNNTLLQPRRVFA